MRPRSAIRTSTAFVKWAARTAWQFRIPLLLLAVFVYAPLAGFGEIADDALEEDGYPWDVAILEFAQDNLHGPRVDAVMLAATEVGRWVGLAVLTLVATTVLALRRDIRHAIYMPIAVVGAAAINIAAKSVYRRDRPSLWESLSPESTYSFPSGHAMDSAAFAAALVVVSWQSRWRWSVTPLAAAFALLVGSSRVYLGVHYPTDVLAGWLAGVAWAVGTWVVITHVPPLLARRRAQAE